VRALGGDAEVGAHDEDALVLAQAGAGVPAVGELLLLVDQRELFALVGLGLLTDIEDGDGGVIVDGDEVAGNDRTT
jgi:hypothetical protein